MPIPHAGIMTGIDEKDCVMKTRQALNPKDERF
jgi:hypothetical protein